MMNLKKKISEKNNPKKKINANLDKPFKPVTQVLRSGLPYRKKQRNSILNQLYIEG
jgi:hypothetical protein